MSCERYDWKAYALGELAGNERREADAHTATCEGCRDELSQLRLTIGSLAALREEEVPRRIAFVSDKVFEPRWWQMFLRPSFAAACVIAAAILVHGYIMRPVVPVVNDAEIQAAVNRAVADVEQRNQEAVSQVNAKLTSFYNVSTGIVRQ
jgi:anti-sigma factor RsiW